MKQSTSGEVEERSYVDGKLNGKVGGITMRLEVMMIIWMGIMIIKIKSLYNSYIILVFNIKEQSVSNVVILKHFIICFR